MKRIHMIGTAALCCVLLAGCATDKSFRIKRDEFDRVATNIAVLPCEDMIETNIVEELDAHAVAVVKFYQGFNNGYRGIVGQTAQDEIRFSKAQAKTWINRFKVTDHAIVLFGQSMIDSAVTASCAVINRFAAAPPARCGELKRQVYIENKILTLVDSLQLGDDSTRQRALSDSVLQRLPGDAVMSVALLFSPNYDLHGKHQSGMMYLRATIISKNRALYWQRYESLGEVLDNTPLETVLSRNTIEQVVKKIFTPFQR